MYKILHFPVSKFKIDIKSIISIFQGHLESASNLWRFSSQSINFHLISLHILISSSHTRPHISLLSASTGPGESHLISTSSSSLRPHKSFTWCGYHLLLGQFDPINIHHGLNSTNPRAPSAPPPKPKTSPGAAPTSYSASPTCQSFHTTSPCTSPLSSASPFWPIPPYPPQPQRSPGMPKSFPTEPTSGKPNLEKFSLCQRTTIFPSHTST
jgi:hypothetical protein